MMSHRPRVAGLEVLDQQVSQTSPAQATAADPVLQAAYDSIMELGLRRTTMVDVARRAGVSRMTIYRRYDDLSRLLSELLTVELGSVMTAARDSTKDLPDARQRLTHTVTRTVAVLIGHPLLTKILAVDPEVLIPFMVDRLGTTQRLAIDELRRFVAAGQPESGDGSIRSGDADAMALTILGFAQSLVFSARAFIATDPGGGIYPELEILTFAYLDPRAAGTAERSHRDA